MLASIVLYYISLYSWNWLFMYHVGLCLGIFVSCIHMISGKVFLCCELMDVLEASTKVPIVPCKVGDRLRDEVLLCYCR